MKAIVYVRNAKYLVDITEAEALQGMAEVPCSECDGSKIFLMPDDTPVPCTPCKGTGKVYVAC